MRHPMSDDAQPKTVPYKNNRVRVLIADDNRDNGLMLGILLRSEGYEVRIAHSGQDAMTEADRFQPHIALLDLQMPDRTGFEVAEHLSRQYNGQWPVLIAVTASTDQTDKHRAELSGFHQFVSKPYRHQALLALLNAFRS
jgi:CheY-like chemotaxis protein